MSDQKYLSTRDGFGIGLVEAAHRNPQVVGLCADLTESTKMDAFAKTFPERFVEVGVAEQNLAGLAAGMALAGKIPFAASYACFHPANSWGVIRTSICYSNLNVKIVGGHGGLVTGADGATHQSLEDIALMRVLPNMTVVVPCDKEEARKATLALAATTGPAYLRTSKYETPAITDTETPFTLGKALTLINGTDVTLIACGVMVAEACIAAYNLIQDGKSVRLINMHTIKPIDKEAILKAAQDTKAIITIEDHQVHGGLGSAVAEVLAQAHTAGKVLPATKLAPLKIMGVEDQFGESGTAAELLEKHKLSAHHIVKAVQELL